MSTSCADLVESDNTRTGEIGLGLRGFRLLSWFGRSIGIGCSLALLVGLGIRHQKRRHFLDWSGDLTSLNGGAIHGKIWRDGIAAFYFRFPGLDLLVAEGLCLKVVLVEGFTVLALDPEGLFNWTEAEQIEFGKALAE